MTPQEKWRLVQETFEAVVDVHPDRREAAIRARLEETGATDLLADTLKLLDAAQEESAAQERLRQPTPVESDTELAGFQLLERLGAGGAGEVYKAIRRVGGVEQQVAVKLFHPHWRSADLDRFHREQEMMATLNHPGVVRFLDAGVAANARPYLVMELVEGRPVDEYCDAAAQTIENRVRLIISVCQAVAAAHARLIVHLDLKPSNILVTGEGLVKVLDFGSARLLGWDHRAAVTMQLTPQYASPEQLRGEPTTVGSDVYALGVILYELLSGRRPFAEHPSLAAAAERAVARSDPPLVADRITDELAAARSVSAASLRSALQGDLSAICAKAMASAPEERYQSAAALAEDLERWARGLPVVARPQTAAYRTWKFLRRNRAPLALTAALAVILAGAAGYGYWQQRQRAAAAEETERMAAFLSWSISSSNSAQGGRANMTVREMVERAVERIEEMKGLSPEVRWRQQASFAWFLQQEGQRDRAIILLKKIVDETRAAGPVADPARMAALGRLAWLHQPADCLAAKQFLKQMEAIPAARMAEMKPLDQITGGLFLAETREQCENLGAEAQYREYTRLTSLMKDVSDLELLAAGLSRGALKAILANHSATALFLMRRGKPEVLKRADLLVSEALEETAGDRDAGNARMQLTVTQSQIRSALGDLAGAATATELGYRLSKTAGGPYDQLRMHTMWGAQLCRTPDKKRAVEVLSEALRENWARENEVDLAWTNNITAAFNLALNARDCSLVPEALRHVNRPLDKMEKTYRFQYRLADGICRVAKGDRVTLRKALDEGLAEGALSKAGEAYRFSEEILAGKR
jgi:hypothetical protein